MTLIYRKAGQAVQPIHLRRLLAEFLPSRGLALLAADDRQRWTPRMLALCALLLPVLGAGALTDRFRVARQALIDMYGSRRRPGRSYNGFVAALAGHPALVPTLCAHFRERMPKVFQRVWRPHGRLVFGVDGTRIECPRTRANQKCLKRAGREKTGPQLMLTCIFHLASGLPWAFERGAGTQSERRHLRKMIPRLPAGSLLLADAGFTGYELLCQLRQAGVEFIVRVGSNVTLLRQLGYHITQDKDRVYLWPSQWRSAGRPPLALRLVRFRSGKQRVCLLVSESNSTRLPQAEIQSLYRQRWVAEVAFRSLKRTFGRHKLASDSPKAAKLELDWSVLSMWIMGMVSLKPMLAVGVAARRSSVAGVLRLVRQSLTTDRHRRCAMRYFVGRIRRAVQDDYVRGNKAARRNYPRKKHQRPPGEPKVRMANEVEIRSAQRIGVNQWAA